MREEEGENGRGWKSKARKMLSGGVMGFVWIFFGFTHNEGMASTADCIFPESVPILGPYYNPCPLSSLSVATDEVFLLGFSLLFVV